MYGLGSAADDLPGFVTINPISHLGGAQNYGSAFLPATSQGTRLGTGSRGVPHIANRHLSDGSWTACRSGIVDRSPRHRINRSLKG